MRSHLIISASLLCLGTGLLAGCGQKGPLVLPARPAAPASAMTSSPAPATSAAMPAPATTSAAPASASSSGD